MKISWILTVGILPGYLAFMAPAYVQAADFNVAAPLGVGDVYGPQGLVEAIKEANRNLQSNNIILEPGTYNLTRPDSSTDGPNGLPTITGAITISTGTFESSSRATIKRSTESGGPCENVGDCPDFRIFHNSSGALALINVEISGGQAVAPNQNIVSRGGGLFNRGPITLLINSIVTGNKAQQGGGIFNGDDNDGRRNVVVLGRTEITNNTSTFDTGGGIHNRGQLKIVDSTISNNRVRGNTGGGGIFNTGTTTLENSTINGNTILLGGGIGGAGILNGGVLDATNTTISGNSVDPNPPAFPGIGNGGGGGIQNGGGGRVSLTNVTIANNSMIDRVTRQDDLLGGGIQNASTGRVDLINTIIDGNSADIGPDCSGTLSSGGFNLIGNTAQCTISSTNNILNESAKLDPVLRSNNAPGGFTSPPATLTHALQDNNPADKNPAIDTGNNNACPTTDQRRFDRPALFGCDMGAFEFNASPELTRRGPVRTVILENTTLTQNHPRGIVIGKDDIVLDCKGPDGTLYKIEGLGEGAGIELKVRKGVTVRNCTVTNFNNGFNIEDSTLNIIVDNVVTNNTHDGFHIVRSVGNIFDHNTAENNGDDGFDLNAATGNFFRSNIVQENSNKGFNLDLSLGNFFFDNMSNGNDDRGFRVSLRSRYNPFAGNTACDNRGTFDFEENSNPNFFRSSIIEREGATLRIRGGNNFCKAFGIRPGESF